MKRVFLSFACVLIFACSVSAQAPRNLRDATFSLMEDGRAVCTAFAANDQLYSAGHCAKKSSGEIYAYRASTNERYVIKLVRAKYVWPLHDTAVFSFVGEHPSTQLQITDIVPQIGEPIWSMVGPQGMSPFLSAGIYSGRALMADEPANDTNGMYCITSVAAPGASGSPVVDQKGRVWGILVGGNSTIPGAALVVLIER